MRSVLQKLLSKRRGLPFLKMRRVAKKVRAKIIQSRSALVSVAVWVVNLALIMVLRRKISIDSAAPRLNWPIAIWPHLTRPPVVWS